MEPNSIDIFVPPNELLELETSFIDLSGRKPDDVTANNPADAVAAPPGGPGPEELLESEGTEEVPPLLSNFIDTSLFMTDGNIRCQLPSRSGDAVLCKVSSAPAASKRQSLRRAMTHGARVHRTRLGSLQQLPLAIRSLSTERRHSATLRPLMQPQLRGVAMLSSDEDDNGSVTVVDSVPAVLSALDEAEQWQELQQVRHMTMSLGRKRSARNTLLRNRVKPMGSYAKIGHLQDKYWVAFTKYARNVFGLQLYKHSLKRIEGHFGSGIMLYFRLVMWIIGLNLLLTVVMLPIIIPQILTVLGSSFQDQYSYTMQSCPVSSNQSYNTPAAVNEMEYTAFCCSQRYKKSLNSTDDYWYQYIADFFQGTGYFEDTILFYGYYFDQKKAASSDNRVFTNAPLLPTSFNMPAAYLLVTAVFFLVSLLFVVLRTSKGLTDAVLSGDSVPCKYTCKVFSGWDYNLSSGSSAKIKQALIKQELQSEIAEDRRKRASECRSSTQSIRLLLIRVCMHVLVLLFLVLAGAGVYFTQRFCDEKILKGGLDSFTTLVVQFSPSVLITILYAICPLVFGKIALLEEYSPANSLIITLARIVLLRLASLFILLLPIYIRVMECGGDGLTCGSCSFDRLKCWETYIGQQMYKLVILDLLVNFAVVFLVEFPRKFLHSRFAKNKIVASVGQEEFNVPVCVMDIVYTQTLCWVGAFFCPLIPAMTFLKTWIFFHLKKLSLERNQTASAQPYRASKVLFFFMLVLTISFIIGVLTIGVTVSLIPPSQGCGPFRVYRDSIKPVSMFSSLRADLKAEPQTLQSVVRVVTSYVFQVPLIAALCLAIYFFVAVTTNSSRRIEILKIQLALETQDKDYLMQMVNRSLKKELEAAATATTQNIAEPHMDQNP